MRVVSCPSEAAAVRSPHCIHDAAAPAGMPISDLDPFAPDFLAEPHAGHAALRDLGPVVWLARYNIAAVARHAEVREVLRDWESFSSARGVGMEDLERHDRLRLPSVILETDPPLHTASRGVLAKALAPARMKLFAEEVASKADAVLDAALTRGDICGVADLAEALPLAVFPDLIGIPQQGRAKLLPHADMMFNSFGPRNALFAASLAGAAHDWVEELGKLEHLAPGSLGAEIHRIAGERGYDPAEAGKLVRALLQAGLDTTVNGLAAALLCLSDAPGQWERLRAEPDLAGAAFDEAVRLESPVQTFFRTAAREVELGGFRLEPGTKVLMFLGAANRDPRRFDDPDTYLIGRNAADHVGFGTGIHHCIGRPLAKLEAETLLRRLAVRVARIEPLGPPERRLNNTVRGLASLPLRLVPAA
ncbi:cytochrome P450 [Erythrobacter sp. NE805]|uniref:cytochrome P450 n=1 Tax=Erythrobacter sp. NE805 TaxID=3389875 RepID=UPI00396B2354